MVRRELGRRYARNRKAWLSGEGEWPIAVTLGTVSEAEASRQTGYVREWVNAWQAYGGPGTLSWRERRWRTLGTQILPDRLLLASPEAVAESVGDAARWNRARNRYCRTTGRWPMLKNRLTRHFDILADYADQDYDRLMVLLAWLAQNPASDLYPRQLPVPGLDSKWLEARKGLVMDLLCPLRNTLCDTTCQTTDSALVRDFYRCCGLRPLPSLVRMRICDPSLRERVGGLCNFAAPVDEIARLPLPAARVFIVENLQTGIAFDDLPGAVVFMALGYGVDVLAGIGWIQNAECIYWGDIDTHGFGILNRARAFLPRLGSRLMDRATLLDHAPLWAEEKQPLAADALHLLTDAEQVVYQGLKTHRWGMNVRLEQERIPWSTAWPALVK